MKYDIDWVKEQYESSKAKYIFFWGHRPNADGSAGKGCFSQWWEDAFEKDGLVFKTAEHWMMYKKAELFNNPLIMEKIVAASTPGEAKKLGRQVSGFDQATWEEHRFDIVVEGNLLKFSQHANLKDFLLTTGNRILVEASPVDNIWGIGLAQDAKQVEDPSTWQGLNLLGFALMEVRDLLKAE